MEDKGDKKSLIENLEAEKLRLEIKNLKKSNWKKPQVVIPIVIVLVTYLFNREYINAKIDLDMVKLERGNIQLQEDEDKLIASKDSIDVIISLKEDELHTLNNQLISLSDSLKSSNSLLNLFEEKVSESERKTVLLIDKQRSLQHQVKYEIKSTRFEQLYRISLDLHSMCNIYEHYRTGIITEAKNHDYSEEDKQNIELIRSHIDLKVMNSWRGRRRMLQSLSTRFEIGFDSYPYNDSISKFQDKLIDIWNRNKEGFKILDDIMAEYHRFSSTNRFNFIVQLESVGFDNSGADAFFNKEVDKSSLNIVTIKK